MPFFKYFLSLSIVWLSTLFEVSECFRVSPLQEKQRSFSRQLNPSSPWRPAVLFGEAGDNQISESNGGSFELTANDLKRLREVKSRVKTLPIVIIDCMLPGQVLDIGSPDKRFRNLIDNSIQDDGVGRIGMIGLKTSTSNPLSYGVIVHVEEDEVERRDDGVYVVSFKGFERFQVLGEPWMDPTNSFFIANIEIIENREEVISSKKKALVQQMTKELRPLVDKWMIEVMKSGKTDKKKMKKILKDIGPMPKSSQKLGLWIAALINPLPSLSVCFEIRPAMISCSNDYERLYLAKAALIASIGHLQGKNP